MMSTDTSFVRYTAIQTRDFYRNLVDRARALPGVASVTLTSAIPLEPDDPPGIEAVIPEGYQFPQGQENVSLRAAAVDERYFSTIGTEIVRGRAFTADDTDGSRRVAIVNQEFARTYWPDQDPIGKRIRLTDGQGPWLEVVGVARTGKYVSINEPPTPFFYKPFAQDVRAEMSLLVETASADAAQVAAPLRDVVRALDQNQPVLSLRTFSSLYEQQAIASPLLLMQTTGTMGALGLTPGADRALRPGCVFGGAPDEGNRHPHGDRRGTVGRAEDGLAAGHEALVGRNPGGRRRERGGGATAHRRHGRARRAEPGDLRRRADAADRPDAGRELLPGAACVEGGSPPRAPIRIAKLRLQDRRA